MFVLPRSPAVFVANGPRCCRQNVEGRIAHFVDGSSYEQVSVFSKGGTSVTNQKLIVWFNPVRP
jgi:hypothetical protein